MKGKLLIVDDNAELLIGFKIFLAPHFETIKTIKSPNLILTEINKNQYDVVLLDMNFKAGINSGNEGLFWMNKIHEIDSSMSVVLITAYSDTELVVNSIKNGAADFIEKSWDENKILSTLLSAVKISASERKVKKLEQKNSLLTSEYNKDDEFVIGKSGAMNSLVKISNKVARTDADILIQGENGTGKEVLAKHIHNNSNRSGEIFVKVDLGSLTETLFESELFGHKKGAFTDAKSDRTGRFEIASGGTLFLDEIGNTPLHLQAKLLSVLQNREVIPLGSQSPVKIDIRLICATNMNLEKMVEEKLFREDLLYRINTIQLDIPSLRERKEDIPNLATQFLNKFAQKYQKGTLKLHPDAIAKLSDHHWSGNIRELQHTLEKAVILSDNNLLLEEDFVFKQKKSTIHTQTYNLAENEKLIISNALLKFSGNISKSSRELGIDRSTLYEKIKKYDI